MLAIQSYDTPISLCIPELRQITFVLHHAVVLSLSILSLRYRAFYYYAVYFLGVIELSSPFLAVVDAARDYPKIAEKYPVTNEICRVMFAIVFYIVRIFGWFPVSYCFWRDALYLLFNSDAAMHQMPKWVPAFWLFTHGFLTCRPVRKSTSHFPARGRAGFVERRGSGIATPRRWRGGEISMYAQVPAGLVGLPHPQGGVCDGHR